MTRKTMKMLTVAATATWAARMVKMGPARSASVHSCMLMSDIARKVPSAMSAITAIAVVRAGQRLPVMRGKFRGIRLVMRMPANRQGTNSGNWSPSCCTPAFRTSPKSMLIWMARMASRKSIDPIPVS
jgi:hypothetical protein